MKCLNVILPARARVVHKFHFLGTKFLSEQKFITKKILFYELSCILRGIVTTLNFSQSGRSLFGEPCISKFPCGKFALLRFKGDYVDGVKQGFGQFWWTSGRHAGDKYVGQFRADRRHGYGQYSFANGNVYDGNWVGALQQARWQINDYSTYLCTVDGVAVPQQPFAIARVVCIWLLWSSYTIYSARR